MKRVILLHGNGGGTGQDGWFPYIKRELEKIGVECLAPDLPDALVKLEARLRASARKSQSARDWRSQVIHEIDNAVGTKRR